MRILRKPATAAAVLTTTLTAACATLSTSLDDAAAPIAAPAGLVTYGGFTGPESAVYDAAYDRYIVTNVGVFGGPGDGYITTLTPEGAVIERAWIASSEDAPLDNPLGSAIHDSKLYVADGASVRIFDLDTAAPLDVLTVERSTGFNDIAIAEDGTIYATETGQNDPATWNIHRIAPDGTSSVFASGAVLAQPNGIEIDAAGDIVVVGLGATDINVFSPAGLLIRTIALPVNGNDGLVVLDDGYIVSSIYTGDVMRAHADGSVETLTHADAAASIALDTSRNRLIIPQLLVHSVTLLDL